MNEPELFSYPVAQLITFYRPGSHDWTWGEEFADLMSRDADKTAAIRDRVAREGIGFIDYVSPILLGTDGRVWDGHHRICIAIEQNIPTVNVEIAGKS